MKPHDFPHPCRLFALMAFVVIGIILPLKGQPQGRVDAKAETDIGTVTDKFNFSAQERTRMATAQYAFVKFDAGTSGEGIANDGTVLIRADDAWYRWRKGALEELSISSEENFQVTNMNRNGAVLGYSSTPVQEGFSCLGSYHGWYWGPDQANGVEVNNSYTFLAFDECGGGYWTIRGFNPKLLDCENQIWAEVPYADDPDYYSAYSGLARWTDPSGQPVQVGYANGEPLGRTEINLEDVNATGTMVGWRIISSVGYEYFIGNQTVDFYPLAINDSGWVIGYDFMFYDGLLWKDGVIHELPLLFPEHINSRGDIVGDTDDGPVFLPVEMLPQVLDAADFDYTPYLIQNKIPPGWQLLEVTGINDSGGIVGYGQYHNPALTTGANEVCGFALYPATLRVDANRDGVISTTNSEDNPDLELVRNGLPWFFWLNDDDDAGETDGDDMPNASSPNGADTVVNGVRDLVDFFPVYLDISSLLQVFPPNDQAITYNLAQDDAAVNFLTTDLTPDVAGSYHSDATATTTTSLAHTAVVRITAGGVQVDRPFLAKILNEGKGVILLEARKPTKAPLHLEVRRAGILLAELSLPLSIAPVEDMFRHVNLSGAVKIAPETKSRSGAPNWSKELENDQAFLFVHGYNVNQQQARGWQAEFFKRLWWSGSRAQFWGVTWYGSDSQLQWLEKHVTPNYHLNAVHAFGTAPQLADFLTELKGDTGFGLTKINVAAHSLGNMVVSSAISDYNAPVDRYFMIDAAVAAEAYDGAQDSHVVQPDDGTAFLPHTEWNKQRGGVYPPRLWATNWYKLFQTLPGDARATLTWRNRFAPKDGTDYYDFHSTGEEVLGYDEQHLDSTPSLVGVLFSELMTYLHNTKPSEQGQPNGTKTWLYQEQLKGRTKTGKILGSNYGGWGFNKYLFKKTPTANGRGPRLAAVDMTPSEAIAAEPYFLDSDLRAEPFFLPGGYFTKVGTWQYNPITNTSSWSNEPLRALYVSTAGSGFAFRHRDSLLAQMIPAMSPAAGRIPVSALDSPTGARNFDMNGTDIRPRQEGASGPPWPTIRAGDFRWWHSDLREVAYPYVRGLYDMITAKGNLKGVNP